MGKLSTVTGETKGDAIYIRTTQNRHDLIDSAYEVVVINGVPEGIKSVPYRENANMERNGRPVALFYVVDDPALKKKILAGRKVQ